MVQRDSHSIAAMKITCGSNSNAIGFRGDCHYVSHASECDHLHPVLVFRWMLYLLKIRYSTWILSGSFTVQAIPKPLYLCVLHFCQLSLLHKEGQVSFTEFHSLREQACATCNQQGSNTCGRALVVQYSIGCHCTCTPRKSFAMANTNVVAFLFKICMP